MKLATDRRFTDEQLAGATLKITDPTAVERLSHDRPDPSLDPVIVGEYDITPNGGRAANPDGPWVWCCHCQAAKHWHGFVITNNTGSRYLIGSACGPKYYGLSFVGAHRQFQEEAQRQGILERLRRLAAAADAIEASVSQILQCDALRAIDLKVAEIRKASPNAAQRLEAAVRNGQELQETVKVRDIEAELRRDEDSSRPAQPIYRDQFVGIGHLEGVALVRTRGDCRERLLQLRQKLNDARRVFGEGTDAVGIRSLLKTVRAAEEAINSAEQAVDESRKAGEFFSKSNVARLERWSRSWKDFSIESDGDRIKIWSKHKGYSSIAPFEDLSIPALKLLGD